MEELGFVVAGVNDGPAEGFAFGNDDPPATGTEPVGSAPLSPAMLADEKAREAKYGTVTLASTTLADTTAPTPAPASPGTASGQPRIYDASEGTPLDPLRNKTYDLSYAKVVPADTMTEVRPPAVAASDLRLYGNALMHERERNGAGVRDIEALDRAREIEAGQTIASLPRQPPQALVLRAEDQRQRARNRFICELSLAPPNRARSANSPCPPSRRAPAPDW